VSVVIRPAGPVGGFQHEDVRAGLLEPEGGGEASDPGTSTTTIRLVVTWSRPQVPR